MLRRSSASSVRALRSRSLSNADLPALSTAAARNPPVAVKRKNSCVELKRMKSDVTLPVARSSLKSDQPAALMKERLISRSNSKVGSSSSTKCTTKAAIILPGQLETEKEESETELLVQYRSSALKKPKIGKGKDAERRTKRLKIKPKQNKTTQKLESQTTSVSCEKQRRQRNKIRTKVSGKANNVNKPQQKLNNKSIDSEDMSQKPDMQQCLCIRPPVCPVHPHGPPPCLTRPPTYQCHNYQQQQPPQNSQHGHWPEPFIIPGPAMGQVMQGMGMPAYIPGAYYFPHFLAIPLPQAGQPAHVPVWPGQYHPGGSDPAKEQQAPCLDPSTKPNHEPAPELEPEATSPPLTPPPVLKKQKKRKAGGSSETEMSRSRKRIKLEKLSPAAEKLVPAAEKLVPAAEKLSPAAASDKQRTENIARAEQATTSMKTLSPLTIKIQKSVDSKGQTTLRVSPKSENAATSSTNQAEQVYRLLTPPPTVVKHKSRSRRTKKATSIVSSWKPDGQPTKKWVHVGNAWKPIRVDCYASVSHVRGIETLHERDTVLVCSADKTLPDVAKISRFFSDPHDRSLWASVLWYYRPDSIELSDDSDSVGHGLHAQELLASRHIDRIPVDAIQDVCYVVTPNEYARYKAENRLDSRLVETSGVEIVSRGEADYPRRRLQPADDTPEEAVYFVRHSYDFPKKTLFTNIRKNYEWVPFFAG